MKVVAYAVAILLVAACGSSSSAARQTPVASTGPAASPTSSASASPAGSPSAPPLSVASYGVLVALSGTGTYAVSLVDNTGKVVASATPSSPTPVTCGATAAAALPLPVSTSNTRLYFLDQQGNVNFLSPNGVTGFATHVPTSDSIRSMFTVSPDDARIAVVENTYSASGATTVLYVEDLNGGTNHVKLFTETGAYTLWPIGWHGAGNLIVAKVASCASSSCGPTSCGVLEYHVVDPATGVRRVSLGYNLCVPIGTPSTAGITCENPSFTTLAMIGWNNSQLGSMPIRGPTPAYLSPDGMHVALVVNNATTISASLLPTLDLVTCGWIDNTHVFAGGDAQSQPRIADLTTGNIAPISAQGVCGGVIPGGL